MFYLGDSGSHEAAMRKARVGIEDNARNHLQPSVGITSIARTTLETLSNNMNILHMNILITCKNGILLRLNEIIKERIYFFSFANLF